MTLGSNFAFAVADVNIDPVCNGWEEEKECHGKGRGWGQGGLLIDEVMPVVGECSMSESPGDKDRHTKMEQNECRGREDRREEIDGSGRWAGIKKESSRVKKWCLDMKMRHVKD